MTSSRFHDSNGIGVEMEHFHQDLTGRNGDTAGLSVIHESLTVVPLHAGASTSRADELIPLEQRISIPEVQSCRICHEERNTPDDPLVELNCKCQGDLSRAHQICILKWFGVRVFLHQERICEICTMPLENITQMVYSAMADHEGSRDILFEAIGAALENLTSIQVDARPINVQEMEESVETISPVADPTVQHVQDSEPDAQLQRDSRMGRYTEAFNRCLCYIFPACVVLWIFWISHEIFGREG